MIFKSKGTLNHSFKNLFILTLLIAICFQPINNVFILVNFKIDQALIEKTLCEQRENQIDCHGTCHLTKQLNQSNSSDQEQQLQILEIKSLEFHQNSQQFHLNKVLTLEAQNMNFNIVTSNISGPEIKIPTPPPRLYVFT